MGLLCICSDNGAIPEIIKNYDNGILVKKNDTVELTHILENLIPNFQSEKYGQMRKKAIEGANNFSIQKFVSSLDNYLQQ